MLAGVGMSVARAAPIFVARLRFLIGFLVAAVAPPKVMPLPTGADDFDMEMAGDDDGVGPRPALLVGFSGSDAADDDDMKLKDEDGAVIFDSGAGGTGVCKKPKPLCLADDSEVAGGGAGVAPPPPINEKLEDCSGGFSASIPPFPMNENPEAAGALAGAGESVAMNEKLDDAGGCFSSFSPSLPAVSFTSNPPNIILK